MGLLVGVFKAKYLRTEGGDIFVQVPQVFGEEQVPVESFVGATPAPGALGFVSFIGGDASYPVWVGAVGGAT